MEEDKHMRLAELTVLALTFIATLMIGGAVYRQTSRHFALQRSTDFMLRYNGDQLVDARYSVDAWLASGESADALDRRAILSGEDGDNAKQTIKSVRTFANFFQELGTAMKHRTLRDE